MNIHTEIQKTERMTKDFAYRFARRLIDEYGTSRQNAEDVVRMFCVSYGVEILGKPCDFETLNHIGDVANRSPINTNTEKFSGKKKLTEEQKARIIKDLMKQRAEQGDADAQFDLGCDYYFGLGVTEDREEALKWWRKAAKQGHTDAQEKLKLIGETNEEPKPEMFRLGDVIANTYYSIGRKFARGEGIDKNPHKAAELWHKAAELGHADAQFSLGVAYAYGIGVYLDPSEAVKWYRMAAEQGHVMAQYALKHMGVRI